MRQGKLLKSSIVFIMLLFCAASAVAAEPPPEPDTPEEITIKNMKCPAHVAGQRHKLTEGVYDCIKKIVDDLADTMIDEVYRKVSNAVTAVLTLAIMFFAIKFVLYGTRQPQAEFFAMLIKFTIVAAMVFGIKTGGGIIELRDVILGTAEKLSNLVFTVDQVTLDGIPNDPNDTIFTKMDNMIFRFYAIDPNSEIKVDKDMAGLAMLGGMALTGPIGAKAFSEGTGVIALLVSSFMIALYIQVVALIALTFMFALSPIIIPLCLFEKTRPTFDKWVRQILSYSLQPMIVVTFLSIMLIVLSSLFGTFDNIVKKSKELENDPQAKKIASFMTSPTAEKSADAAGQGVNTGSGLMVPSVDSTVAGQGVGMAGGGVQLDQLVKGVSTIDKTITVSPMDEGLMKSLISQLILLLITCGALFRFMKELPAWASELAGGDRTVPNLFSQQPIKEIDQRFNKK